MARALHDKSERNDKARHQGKRPYTSVAKSTTASVLLGVGHNEGSAEVVLLATTTDVERKAVWRQRGRRDVELEERRKV
jgi:hypothetical protein